MVRDLHPDVVDAPEWAYPIPETSDEPLLRVRIGVWDATRETTIGLTWAHFTGMSFDAYIASLRYSLFPCAGDGMTISRFFRNLNSFYLGLPPMPRATYEHYFSPPPSVERHEVVDGLMHLPHLVISRPLSEFWEDVMDRDDSEQLVDLKLLSYAYLEAGVIEMLGA